MFPGLIARPLRAAMVVLVVAAIAAAWWAWDRAQESTPVDAEEAVREFRAAGNAGSARPGVPRPGVYGFRQSGSERGGVGPVNLTRDLPERAVYTVTAVAGGYREELAISEEHVEASRLRVDARGTRRLSTRTKVTFLGVGRDDRRRLLPAPLRFPARLRVGAAWSDRYVAGSLPVEVASSVLRKEVVEVEGRRMAVLVVRTVTETGGTHPGRRVDTVWWSAPRALPLRWSIATDIRGIAKLRTRTELELESLQPRV